MSTVRVGGVLLALTVLSCNNGSSQVSSSCEPFEGRTEVGGSGTATGLALYDKRVITAQGPSGAITPTPIRFADIEVIHCQTNAVLASGATDGNGEFQLAFDNSGRVGVYVRVLSVSSRYGVSVRRSASQPVLYGLASLAYDDAGDGEAVVVTGLRTGGTIGAGAFNILDQGVRGGQTIETLAGAGSGPSLVWYWFPGNQTGTSYSAAAKAISVLGTTADPDEFDDAVLLHEYGHYVLDVYSRDDSQGGPHTLGDSALDLRLAWSEGWATFFSSVVRNDPVHIDASLDDVRLLFDIETPSFGAATRYDTNELAVAAVLWDAYDADNGDEGSGPLSGLLPEVWSVVRGLTTSPVSFEDFWVAWQVPNPGDLRPILEARNIDLWADDLEAGGDDNDPSRAKPIDLYGGNPSAIQHHSLYPAGDVDHVVFTPQESGTYAIATSRCLGIPALCDARVSNAADTIVSVLGGGASDNLNGQTYSESCTTNCPPNDATTLSSRVTFAATSGVPYIIRVSRSPIELPSAGELGTYDLLVTAE